MHITPDVKDFPALVRWVADTYHRGAVYKIGEAVGIAQATADKWVHNRATPSLDLLVKFCAAYELDLNRVIDIVRRTKKGTGEIKRILAAIVAALLALSTARVEANPTPDGWNLKVQDAPYRHWLVYLRTLTDRYIRACVGRRAARYWPATV